MGAAQILIAYFSYQKRKGEMGSYDRSALIIGIISLGTWIYLRFHGDQGIWWLPISLIFIADAVGFFPTIRDAWMKPVDDDPTTWLVFSIVGVLVLTGLWLKGDSTMMDFTYPLYETLLAVSTWLILLYRRR